MTGTDVTAAQKTSHELTISDEQVDLLKRTICKGSTNDELQLFLATAQRLGLDPFSKQIHAVKRREFRDGQWQDVMSMQVGIDGFRLQAQRSGRYAGQEGPWWCGPDGEWHEVWPWSNQPIGAKVVVLLHGAGGIVRVPAVAHWHEYAATKADGSLTKMWATKGSLMLAKCAEALALRKAFPAELSGIYSPDEMAQADNSGMAPAPLQTQPVADPKPAPKPRPVLELLGKAFEGAGLSRAEVRDYTHAALNQQGVPPNDRLDARLAAATDDQVKAAADALASEFDVVDAEVVEGPGGDLHDAEQLEAFERALEDDLAGQTATAIEGDPDAHA